jgi:hypothetical protein
MFIMRFISQKTIRIKKGAKSFQISLLKTYVTGGYFLTKETSGIFFDVNSKMPTRRLT